MFRFSIRDVHCLGLSAEFMVLAVLTGCAAPGVETKFAIGEEVSVEDYSGRQFKGVVRQHDRARGFLVSYYDDRFWTTREEWIREEKLTSRSTNPTARAPKKDFDLSPLYQAMGRASAGVVLVVLIVLAAVWAVNRGKLPPPDSKSVIQ